MSINFNLRKIYQQAKIKIYAKAKRFPVRTDGFVHPGGHLFINFGIASCLKNYKILNR